MSTLPSSNSPANEDAINREMLALKQGLVHLKEQLDGKKKDGWDKAGIVAQVISGTLIAVLGIAFAVYSHSKDVSEKEKEFEISKAHDKAQFDLSVKQNAYQLKLEKEHNDAELDLANRKNFMDFFDEVIKTDPKDRAGVLDKAEYVLTPDQSIRIVMGNLHPPIALQDEVPYEAVNNQILESEQLEFNHAILSAEHLKSNPKVTDFLREKIEFDVMPDSEIFRSILGGKTKVYIRASSVDDFANVKLNGVLVFPQLTFGEDSGWIDITNKLKINNIHEASDVNRLEFLVINSPYGGFGGRFQISAGTEQYDTGPYANPNCPCNKAAFSVVAELRVHPDRTVQLKAPVFTKFAP